MLGKVRKVRKRAIRYRQPKKLLLTADVSFWEKMDAVREDMFKLTKVRISRAFILREGANKLLAVLRKQIKKAREGELHAKKRADIHAPIIRRFTATTKASKQ